MNTAIRSWFGRQSGERKVMIVVITLGLALLSIYYKERAGKPSPLGLG
ncbi:hypothetical protein JQC72_01015 [Polycladomyces sp. WAk]|uniref:Uncharacterized protein n=1 Tax=Polycladomyces zharkentensis TaxID=2807616 RepID=A0ABS2WF47_9BACL|nr:hypothetical protein [Polycladomyces sp. WAk]MBN2908104.1 hypothetical protein [Polycladomyces sp. WAk]